MITTVVVPTHSHGPLLRYSIASALAQTEPVEVIIIGDGVTGETDRVARELEASDERVRYVDRPKDPRAGEAHRNAVLRELATGDVVCYLSDDDLWASDHVAVMRALLSEADFAHAPMAVVMPDGTIDVVACDLSIPYFRDAHLRGHNRIALSCGAHTTRAFRQLRHGWQTPPPESAGDLTMWQQFLGDNPLRCASSMVPTVLVFPSLSRRDRSLDQRVVELEGWWDRLRREGRRGEIGDAMLAAAMGKAMYGELRNTMWWKVHERVTGGPRRARATRVMSRTVRALRHGFRG
jgi:hypothetical protein